jgi:hypothetical protein
MTDEDRLHTPCGSAAPEPLGRRATSLKTSVAPLEIVAGAAIFAAAPRLRFEYQPQAEAALLEVADKGRETCSRPESCSRGFWSWELLDESLDICVVRLRSSPVGHASAPIAAFFCR